MTLTAVHPTQRTGQATGPATRSLLERPLLVVALGVMLSAAMSWPQAVTIWKDNTFFDTDDAMRLVQVRAWLDGQGWFDLVAHRLDPPDGLLMHWSRVVDVPLAALIRLFDLFVPQDQSERLARIAFPLALQVALIGVTVAFGRMLAGPRALFPAMVLVLFSGFNFEQFPAGRIDHHAPQIVLLVGMSAALLSALAPGRASHAALAALCLALSLSISLENLPFIAVLVAVLPLVWVVRAREAAAAMLWFGGGLVLSGPALFAATVPPERYGVAACDAYSVAHLLPLTAGAAGLMLLAALTGRLNRPLARALALGAVGAAVGGLLLAGFPDCLRGPYATMDPVLQRLWLSHVTEAQPLLAASRVRPDTMTIVGCPLFVGAGGLIVAVWRERGWSRLRWAVILALTLAGIAGTFWEVRVASSAQPLALLGGVWTVTALLDRARRQGSLLAGTAAALLLVPFATVAWALVPTPQGDPDAARALARGQNCRATGALSPLAALPPGLVFAPIDDGSHLLVATPHAVIAAPYHRDQAGNRRSIDGFMAAPADAEAIVQASGARYLAICPGEVGISLLAAAAPEGLAARLVAGQIPAWLHALDVGASPFRVYEVRPD